MSDNKTRLEQEAAFARSFAPLIENERRKFDVIDLRSTRENLRLTQEKNRELEDLLRQAHALLARYGLTAETWSKPNGWRDLVQAHDKQLQKLRGMFYRAENELNRLKIKNRAADIKRKAEKSALIEKARALHERQKLRDETRLERLAALRCKSSKPTIYIEERVAQRALRDGRSSKVNAAPGDAMGNAGRSVRAASR